MTECSEHQPYLQGLAHDSGKAERVTRSEKVKQLDRPVL